MGSFPSLFLDFPCAMDTFSFICLSQSACECKRGLGCLPASPWPRRCVPQRAPQATDPTHRPNAPIAAQPMVGKGERLQVQVPSSPASP